MTLILQPMIQKNHLRFEDEYKLKLKGTGDIIYHLSPKQEQCTAYIIQKPY